MKTINVKKQFVKKNFLTFFCAFVLPTLLLGAVMVWLSWREASEDIGRRMENSLNLVEDHLDGLTGESKGVNVYIESSSLTSGLSRMMNSRDIQYPEMISIRHFSAFINSVVNSDSAADSIYIYLPNSINRVYTSAMNFVFLDSLTDREWVEMLVDGEKEQWITKRNKKDYSFEKPREVITVFCKFHNFAGGSAVNYSAADISRIYDSMMFYENQSVIITDDSGRILMHNAALQEAEAAVLNDRINAGANSGSFIMTADYPEYGLHIITSVPKRTLYSIAMQNARVTILITLMIAVVTIILAYGLSLKSYRQLNQVVTLFDYADKKQPLPQVEYNNRDMYSQILHNIIRIFIENNYLQVQLSERKYRLQTAQLQALQYQINPHFLYNTLQTINYEILSLTAGRQTQANSMVENLSDIMRFSLESGDSMVSLKEEIENCRKYIRIQQARYDNGFQVVWDVEDMLLSNMVLRLILQPIVENSIVHGVKSRESGGKIKITVRSRGSGMEIRICDNGSGIGKERLQKIRENFHSQEVEYTADHIGLQNCCHRLVLAYSEESELHIRSKMGMGTLVYFSIPL